MVVKRQCECRYRSLLLIPAIGVTECATFRIDLSVVDKSEFKKKTRRSDGRRYLKIQYNIVVKVEGARVAFSFECGGKEYDALSVEYDVEDPLFHRLDGT